MSGEQVRSVSQAGELGRGIRKKYKKTVSKTGKELNE